MNPHDDPNLPDRLTDDLAALYRAEVRVPQAVDRFVTSGARAHFARRSRWIRWAAAGGAIAAVLVMSVSLFRSQYAPPTHVAVDSVRRDGDADGNASIDIRDALALARKVEAGSAAWTRWDDVNGDKVIDRKDVDAIAMMAVSLRAEVVR